jgi:hypothetical protein
MGEPSTLRHQQVAKLAYDIWEKNGRPADSAERDWLQAEDILEFGDPAKSPFGAFSVEAKEERVMEVTVGRLSRVRR